jgi:hypothetical protein
MTHSLRVLSWAHPVCLLLQQPSTQSKSTSPSPGHTGQAPLSHPYFPSRAPEPMEGPQGVQEGRALVVLFFRF